MLNRPKVILKSRYFDPVLHIYCKNSNSTKTWFAPGSCWITHVRTHSGLSDFHLITFWVHITFSLWIAKLVLGGSADSCKSNIREPKQEHRVANLNPCTDFIMMKTKNKQKPTHWKGWVRVMPIKHFLLF